MFLKIVIKLAGYDFKKTLFVLQGCRHAIIHSSIVLNLRPVRGYPK